MAAPPAAPSNGEFALVLTARYHAIYETPDKSECPDGLQYSLVEQYRSIYRTEDERRAHDVKFAYYAHLGPNGENVFFNPTVFKDPLPFKELKSRVALGLNLDGKDGDNDFVDPDGRTGIDNELYRVAGCVAGFRTKGSIKETASNFMRISPYNRIVLEVTGVDSMVDDPEVQVAIYRGLDPVPEDGEKNAIPWRTQRIDTRTSARFEARLKGHIEGGYLVTEPKDVVLPDGVQAQVAAEQPYRQMRLRLKLSGVTAEGIMGGYDDVEGWWRTQSKLWGAGAIAEFNHFSPSTLYAALKRYADAYPDPRTGENTAISSAYVVRFVRTIIARPQPMGNPDAPVRPLTTPGAPEQVVAEAVPSMVRLQYTDFGFVYANGEGRTLYTWNGDTPGKSNCNDVHVVELKDAIGTPGMTPEADKRPTCQRVWPPMTAPAGFEPVGKWSAITRHDGSRQLAYAGQPLYASVLDHEPGELNGSGVRAPLWARFEAPPQVQVVTTRYGRVLANGAGMVLYVHAGDTATSSACAGDCLGTWQPFLANELASPVGDWSTIERPDGARQWAYRGHPLYAYGADERPSVAFGHGIGPWRAAVLQQAPARPEVIGVGPTTGGDVLTDRSGKTLYRFVCSEYTPDRLNCDGPDSSQMYRLSICGGPERCGQTWRYLAANGQTRPAGRTWSVVQVDPVSGVFCTNRADTCTQKVWAYMGRPVYTFAGDRRPGDLEGDQIRTFPFMFTRLRPDFKVEP